MRPRPKIVRRLSVFLKNVWAKEPVVVSMSVWGLDVIMPTVSPNTKYATMTNQDIPYNNPVPV